MSFSCVIIGRGPQSIACAELWLGKGHRIRCVVSSCAQVKAWCQKVGVTRQAPGENLAAVLGAEPFEFLFSIVNHAITPPNILAMASHGAVNYHDSPLPAYGGFNATAWAILQGAKEHGITWHRMTSNVDAGSVLLQRGFPIGDEDTAFSLSARAGELAVRSFADLLEKLETGGLQEQPGQPVAKFHFRSERPGFAALDWNQPVAALSRLVRGLDFGTEDNWMTRAKVRTPQGDFLCVGSVAMASVVPGVAGVIGRIAGDSVTVNAADGSVVLSELTTIEGEALTSVWLEQHGVVPGAVLPSFDSELAQNARALDLEVTGKERYWQSKLVQLLPNLPAELNTSGAIGETQRLSLALPSELARLTHSQRAAAITAALCAYLARVGDAVSRVDLGIVVDGLAPSLRPLYAAVVPLALKVQSASTWADLQELAAKELADCSSRKTFSRDIYTRYGALRTKTAAECLMPLAIAFCKFDQLALPVGTRLLIACADTCSAIDVVFDTGAIGRLHAERLVARILNMAAAALRSPQLLIAALPLVTPDERTQLLETFQDTHRPDAQIACIHNLFEEQARKTPHATALVFREETLSYAEVDARSNALAHRLVAAGVGPDKLVAVSIERSLDMVVGLYAILKAGGAYVPLDPAYPQERLAIMLQDSGARWLLTESHLASALPRHNAEVLLVNDPGKASDRDAPPTVACKPEHLAYVIFTSGSTGRPKGVMVEHRNVANFFAGMDERVGQSVGTWLAVTSISFDISVLEIFWTLARGFKTVIQEEGDRASLLKSQADVQATARPMGFGLFYFAADSKAAGMAGAYRLLLQGAKFADTHDFTAIWTPERHFHEFGGLYPNAAITSAAVAATTSNIQVRAGSVVIPLHDPIRVAEDWAMVDNLSGGRVGLSFASGWHANDFALKPDNYERRHEVMRESIDTVLRLWRGEKISVKNGRGETIEVSVLPRPVRERPPMWIASAGNIETFRSAGRMGYNILTNMLGQDLKDLREKFAAYRQARHEGGHEGDGTISVMLHTFVTDSDDKARELSRRPFGNYLKSSYDLVKVAPWMFPAFKRPSAQAAAGSSAFDAGSLDESDMEALLDHAFDRYFDTAGLFGTPARALRLVEQLKDIGATEVACLIDFGVDPEVVLENLVHLDALRRLANPRPGVEGELQTPVSIREQFEKHSITHFQCTPSMARMLVADGTIDAMTGLQRMLVGGEAMPTDLAHTLTSSLPSTVILNMYGPTETTVWSTVATLGRNGEAITIGTPIANTQIRLLDKGLGLVPVGTAAELCIGGGGVVRGYWNQPEMTATRFFDDPFATGNRLYRTGDLARFLEDGSLQFIGRIDQQVKVNGYRIELGEIETILGRHAAVKEVVVAVKNLPSGPSLVGYVVAAGAGADSGTSDVNDWKRRWEEAYANRAGAAEATARFNTSGWLSSYTGEPIHTEQMREWLDATAARILALRPKRILEIGCGTGMVLYACLASVDHYTALDLSPFALESIRAELSPVERQKVTLLNQAAHELKAFADHSFDLVVINSVAQYFPNAEYFADVCKQASRVLIDGGKIFLGDVRSLEEARAFHSMVELQKAPGQMQRSVLDTRMQERANIESELLVGQGFFAQLQLDVPRLTCISMQLKQGKHANEMRDFRCDVVLQAGPAVSSWDPEEIETITDATALSSVKAALVGGPSVTLFLGILNSRLAPLYFLDERKAGDETVEALRTLVAGVKRGIDPNDLFNLSTEHAAELRFGKITGTIDVLYRHKSLDANKVWPVSSLPNIPNANTPKTRSDTDALVPNLKAHIRGFLPEYMVPQSFVFLNVFPLTPNGKIDRNALPLPTETTRQLVAEYVVPGNDLERKIAGIWSEMLGVQRVGRKDNIFDLGASSLLTVEANGRLQKELGRKIPLVSMFRYPTIESLAGHLAKQIAAELPEVPTTEGTGASAERDRQSRLEAAAERRRQARSRSS